MSSWTVQLAAGKGDSRSGSYAGSSGGSSHGGISPQSLISINRNNNSNYMNITNDDLFPGEMMESSHTTTDDMALSYGQQKLGMVGMMSDRNSHSLPNGLPPGSVAKYNTPSPTSQQFLVEHLASFPQDVKSGYLTPAEALTKLKKISSGGGLWAQNMNMNISINRLVMANGETMEMIEEYPLEQISLCTTVLDDPMFEQLLIFNTKLSKDKVGAVHLFQCKADEANVISEVINKSREQKASKYVNGGANGSNEVSEGSHSHSSSDVEVTPPRETRTQLNLQQKHAVARAVEAFQTTQLQPKLDGHPTNEVNGNLTPIQDAKISRDVEILNRCIGEIENFVVMLKRINEARKELQTKRKSKKKKTESILILQSQPPPDHRIYDIYQKFKHSLNLLAKLRPHINEPNAPELIHYLFIPLGIIVKVTGIDKARVVVDPLLTLTCVDLLVNCLDSREYHFWQSLGPNWTLTKSAEQFKDKYFQPYMPIFADGWVPPEIVANEKQEAAARSTAAMVARMKGQKISAEVMNTNPTVLLAAMKFKRLGEKAQRQGLHTSNTASVHPPQRSNSFDRVGKRLVGIVVYDYMAHNNKELTIRAGEKVYIIDNTRRWWLVQNYHGEQGYVPSTVLEIPTSESGMSSPRDSVDHISPNESPCEIKLAQSLDSNQNYVNGTSWPSNMQTTLPQPVHTITPVLISVQLPDGSQVQTNANGTHIIASPAGMKPTTSQATGIQIGVHPSNVQQNGTQQNGVQQNAIHHQSSTSPPLMFQTGVQENGTNIQQSDIHQTGQISPTYAVVNKIKSTNKIISQNRTSPPDTAAVPPPPPPPMVSPKPHSVLVSKEANFQVQSAPSQHLSTNESKGDIHNELKNRLSFVQPKQHQVEETVPSIDAVDVFIPLYKSSTADDVSRWLFKLGFSERTIDILKGKTAHDLFNIDKERMIDLIGHDEGLQLHEELLVQNGAENRHKTLTEFQKALVKRVQKREEQQESARDDFSKKIQDQTSFIKKQKEELERHKNEARNPASATFTSFSSSSIDVGTPQAKTKL